MESTEELTSALHIAVTYKLWVVLMISLAPSEICLNQSEALPRSRKLTSPEWNFCTRSSDVISLFPQAKLALFEHVSRNAQTAWNNDP